ncbi:MAG: DUF2807 domain-containing protein [Caldilineales bacterium]|nr:DUF2807 domain-containing protein [Caldilineales bacterium]
MLKIALALLIPTAMLLTACTIPPNITNFSGVTGSGNLETRTYDFSDFTGLDVSNAFQIEITRDDNYAVEVTVDDNLIEHLKVEQNGSVVTISLEPNLVLNRTTQKAKVTMPVLTNLTASGAVSANLSGFESSQDLQVDVSGASRVQGDIQPGDLSADVSGGSTLRLTGSGGDADVTASGASTADLADFPVVNANAEASGASRINLNVSGVLRAEASGASNVSYTGNPTVERADESGASSITGK